MTALRVVLDTNVLLSGIAYPASIPGRIMAAWRQGSVGVLLCPHILEELRRVLPKLAHKHQLDERAIDELVDILYIQAELVEPPASTTVALHDTQDPPVLAALLHVQADYLITGNKDLLVLAAQHAIVTPAQFWATHGGL